MPVPVPHVCISVCVGEGGARGLGLRNMSVCIYLKILCKYKYVPRLSL